MLDPLENPIDRKQDPPLCMPQRSFRVQSEAIRGHQRSPEAIRGHQRPSERLTALHASAILSSVSSPSLYLMREAIRRHQTSSEVIERLLAELVPFVRDDATERGLDFECRRAAEAQIESVIGERFDLMRSSAVISGHQRSSEVIRGHQARVLTFADCRSLQMQMMGIFEALMTPRSAIMPPRSPALMPSHSSMMRASFLCLPPT
jgi:hypothetical protein